LAIEQFVDPLGAEVDIAKVSHGVTWDFGHDSIAAHPPP
jgi:hypothetical protein